MAQETTEGTRDAAGTQVSATNARDPIPAAPAASAGRGPRPVPSFSSRCLQRSRSCNALSDGLGRGAATSGTRTALRPSSQGPPRRGRVRRSRRVSPEAGRRGGISTPPGRCRPVSRPHPRHAPYRFRRPGRWRLRATDAGTAPSPDPPGQPPGGPPKDAPGSLPSRRGQVAANEHKIGTLSRFFERTSSPGRASSFTQNLAV